MPPLSTQQPPQIETPNYLLRISVSVLAIALIGTVSYFGYKRYQKISTQPTILNQGYLELKDETNYRLARESLQKGDYLEALEFYRKVNTSNIREYSLVQYEIANTQLNFSGNDGVKALTELSATSSVNNQTKAYAINALAAKYSASHDSAFLSLVMEQLTLAAPKNIELANKLAAATTAIDSLIGLYEVSSFFFPISDSEINLAYLYSIKASRATLAGNTEEANHYATLAKTKIVSADQDFDQAKKSENLSWMYPYILMRKAMALEQLKTIDPQTESPEVYFDQALTIAAAQGQAFQPFIQYNYATFLQKSKTGESDQKTILLLQPIVENKNSRQSAKFFEFTKNAYKNNEAENIKNLDALAKIYPPFGEVIR